MERKEYNGWTNYETWLCALWIDNDEGGNEAAIERAEQALRHSDGDRDEAANDCAESIKSEYEEFASERVGSTGFLSDLVSAALGEINWREIAEHHVDAAWDSIGEEFAEERPTAQEVQK